jgi:Uma2 family endonuclease
MKMASGAMTKAVHYPTSDGKPMAETDLHRINVTDSIQTLDDWFAADDDVYVSGNVLVFYVPGNRRKHVSPDVFVVKGIRKKLRENYLVWLEGKAPDAAIEMTSKSTAREDLNVKFDLYENVLKIQEYFLFDPRDEYLRPALQGFRLVRGKYVRIKPIDGRLPSQVLGLHLERDGGHLRFWDPVRGQRLLTEHEARLEAEAEAVRLRQELANLRRRNGK